MDFLTSEKAYAEQNVKAKTYLPIECQTCKFRPQHTSILNFVFQNSAECLCRWKTQRLVHEAVDVIIDRVHKNCMFTIGEHSFDDSFSSKGARMPYDIVVCRSADSRVVMIIELDGKQHFVDGLLLGTNFEATQRNDVQKEINAVDKGIPMIRLYQRAVYRGKFDWRQYLESMISQAWQGTLAPKVYRHPGEPLYLSGSYRALREGTKVAV